MNHFITAEIKKRLPDIDIGNFKKARINGLTVHLWNPHYLTERLAEFEFDEHTITRIVEALMQIKDEVETIEKDNSFITVIISAHGGDILDEPATDKQRKTLRKFTVPGKSGHLAYNVKSLTDTIFYLAHELAKFDHLSFTEKLKLLKEYLLKERRLQLTQQGAFDSEPDDIKPILFASFPIITDWFHTSQVSYNHIYKFMVNNPANPWELTECGIWLVDGSPRVMQDFKDEPTPDTMKYYDIMELLDLPKWPGTNTTTTLFELADRIQRKFGVEYVNFIDLSCRCVYSRMGTSLVASDDVRSAEASEPRRSHDPVMHPIGDTEMEIVDTQPTQLPDGWMYVKNPADGTYLYANTVTGEISVDFPNVPSGASVSVPSKIKMGDLTMETAVTPTIRGMPLTLPPDWVFAKGEGRNWGAYINTKSLRANPFFPGIYRSGGRSKKRMAKKPKSVRRGGRRSCKKRGRVN
jgi:hypothetical protein